MSEYDAAMQPGEADRTEDAAMAENPDASGTDANAILREQEELENEVEDEVTPSAAEKAKAFVVRKKEELLSKIRAIFFGFCGNLQCCSELQQEKAAVP